MCKMYTVKGGELVEVEADEKDLWNTFTHVQDEMDDWLAYREHAAETGDARYTVCSEGEYKHMLVALSDAIHYVHKHVKSDVERTEYAAFKNALP